MKEEDDLIGELGKGDWKEGDGRDRGRKGGTKEREN